MKRLLKIQLFALILTSAALLVGCKTEVLKELPTNRTLSYEEIVYVENDGRCDTDQVIKVIGGKMDNNIPRKYECVQRP